MLHQTFPFVIVLFVRKRLYKKNAGINITPRHNNGSCRWTRLNVMLWWLEQRNVIFLQLNVFFSIAVADLAVCVEHSRRLRPPSFTCSLLVCPTPTVPVSSFNRTTSFSSHALVALWFAIFVLLTPIQVWVRHFRYRFTFSDGPANEGPPVELGRNRGISAVHQGMTHGSWWFVFH